MAPKASKKYKGKGRMKNTNTNGNFELDMSGEFIGGDNVSVESDAGASDDDDFLETDNFPAGPSNVEGGIIFAQDDELPTSDIVDETGFDDYDENDLQGFDDLHDEFEPQASEDLGGTDGPDGDFVPDGGMEEDEDDEPVVEPNAKRARKMAPAPLKSALKGHFPVTTHAAERAAKRVTIEDAPNFEINEDENISYNLAPVRKSNKSFGRWDMTKGSTLPAYHKRVTHELDSDDELMMNMRDKGYADKQIADRLRQEKNVRYDAKSIATRSARIRIVQSERCDFELENGMKEWTVEDDHLLLRAYDLAEVEVAYEIERIRAWRFKKTAEWMRRLNRDSMFSGKACHKRYSALMDGTAAIPCDVDDDPVQRRKDMEQFRQDCIERHEQEQEEKNNQETERQRIKEEAAIRNSQKAVKSAENARIKAAEQEARAAQRATKKALTSQQADENVRKQKKLAEENLAKKAAKEEERKVREQYGIKHFKHITQDSPDPRRVLSYKDLKTLCSARKINFITKLKGEAAKKELVKRLRDADEQMSANRLTELCKTRYIPYNGTKIQKIYQLALYAARTCESFVEDEDEDEANGGDEAEPEPEGGMMDIDGDEPTNEFV